MSLGESYCHSPLSSPADPFHPGFSGNAISLESKRREAHSASLLQGPEPLFPASGIKRCLPAGDFREPVLQGTVRFWVEQDRDSAL